MVYQRQGMYIGEEIKPKKNNAMWSNNNITKKTNHLVPVLLPVYKRKLDQQKLMYLV